MKNLAVRKKFITFVRMKKFRLAILISLLLCNIAVLHAYRDHRDRHIEETEAALAGSHPPKGKELLKAYMDLMSGYMPLDGDKAVMYARKALALSYQLDTPNARESALYNLGLAAYGDDDFDTALGYFQQALAVTDSLKGDPRYTQEDIDDNLSQLYGAIGNLYNLQDKCHLAIEYYQRALPIFERHNWLQSQTILYHNIGEMYLSMGNMQSAEQNFLKAIEKGSLSEDSLMVALAQKGLTKVYLGQDPAKALQTAQAAYGYYHAHRAEEPNDYTTILAELARIYLKDAYRNLPKAKAYAREALTFADSDLMSENRCDIFAVNAEVAMAENQWQQAYDYALQSVHEDSLASFTDVSCYVLLAHICTELGKKDEARDYVSKIYNKMEQFATDHYQSALSEMEVIYETEKKGLTISHLEQQRRRLMVITALSVALLLLSLLAIYLVWRNIRLNQERSRIVAKLQGEQEERVRIARDLHDRLGGILTALKLKLADGTAADDAQQNKTAVVLTDEAISEMRNVSHHLLPDSLQRHGLRTALRDYCQTMKNVTFSFVGDEKRIRHEETIYCIVYELVNNAVKSSGAEHIRVQMVAGDDFTAINVSDDGNGGLKSHLGQEEGSGLQNLQERLSVVGGRLDMVSEPGKGTEINIEIPHTT